MMKNLLSGLVLSLCISSVNSATAQSPAPAAARQQELMAKASGALLFVPNAGQLEDRAGQAPGDIRFTASRGPVRLFFGPGSIHYQFTRNIYADQEGPVSRLAPKPVQQQTHRFTLELEGSNPSPRIRAEDKSGTAFNYYTEAHPEGITGLASYRKLVYEDIYPHIDWVVYSKDDHLKYDFVVHPGGDPSLIRMKVKDAGKVSIITDGSMLLETSLGNIQEAPPVSFADGRAVPSRYRRNDDGSIGFEIQPEPGKTLTIDPYVAWSTYYGGSGSDGSVAFCTTDASGNIFMGGMTNSTTDIASGGFQNTYGGGVNSDAFLVKFDASGARLWATYYGGGNDERGNAGAADASGNIYLAGETNSSGMASGGFQNTYGGATTGGAVGDAFLAKFNSAGVRIWATYYGGSNDDRAFGCAVDPTGNVYLAGSTNSTAGITSGGFQNTYGGGSSTTSDAMGDAFLVKFDASGARLWGTYYGGSDYEIGNGCATDASGNVYLVGRTPSNNNIASAGAFQTTLSTGVGAFLAKFTPAGTRVWGTYYGSGYAEGVSCVVDGTGNIYMAGHTSTNANNVASGGFQNTLSGGNDAFLAKFNAAGVRQWGTYYGGTNYDFGFSTAMDAAGFIYLAGQTQSTAGIASGGFQNSINGSYDAFVAKFNAAGVRQWGTYYGGSGVEGARSCATGPNGSLYITGFTTSSSGIGTGGFQNIYGGGADAFLARIREQCIPDTTTYTQVICNSQLPYTWQGNTLTAGGIHVAYHTFQNVSGCDSVVFLNLTVNAPVPVVHVYDTVCRNVLPIIWNNLSINMLPTDNSGTYNFSAAGSNGCDSVTTLHLFVKDSTLRVVDSIVCATQMPITWNNIVVTAGGPGAAVYHGFTTTGCDSTIRLNLTVSTPSATTDNRTICSNQLPYTWNNIVVTASGNGVATYTTTQTAGACDSVVTLNLTVNNVAATTANITICTNELPYTWNGFTLTTGGNAIATFDTTNTAGCDSVVTLNLTVSPAVTPVVTIAASPGTSIMQGTPVSFAATVTNGGNAPVVQWLKNGLPVGGNSANYTDLSLDSGDVISCILVSNAPCALTDSAASNTLTMNVTPPPPPCLVPVTLISTDIQFETAVFRWASVAGASGYEIVLDMQPSDPSSGLFTTDTVYHASALTPGMHYFHIRTKCPDNIYSPWITITIVIQDAGGATGINDPAGTFKELSLYPNPNNGVFHVAGIIDGKSAAIDIIDKTGRAVYKSEAVIVNGKLDHEVRLGGIAQGVYLIRVSSGREIHVIRFAMQ